MEPTQHGYRHPVKGTGAHRPTKGNGRSYRWLMEHVSHQGDACLIWPFGRDRRINRGSLGYKGTRYWAHRLMCEMAHGAPPTPKHQAAHNCGKGHYCCVNPRHLEWKTNTQNQLDRAVNGNALRNPHGPGGALSDEQKAGIMALKGKMPQTKIAAKFGVSLGCVQYWLKYREARGHHVQKMKVWSADETKRLHIAIERGLTLAEMASFIGRPKAAIAAKRTRLRHSCRCQ
jgi:hypothetical protein